MKPNYDLDSLFHPNVDFSKGSSQSDEEYSPSADKGTNGVYQSVIRFIPWWQDPQHSIFDKWVCFLVDPVTNRGRSVDCPSSVGKPSLLQDMYFKLKKSESIQDQKKADIFSRRHQYASLIQVIKDPHNPKLEGKILVFKFGKKIFEKLEAEKKPLVGEPHEPFDLLYGKPFQLIITKQSGFNNYDQSKFLSSPIPLMIPVNAKGEIVPLGTEGSKLAGINERTPKEMVFNYLKENSPDLNKYAFKDWDMETIEYVNQIIVQVTGEVPSNAIADIRNSENLKTPASKSTTGSKTSSKNTGIIATELSLDELSSEGLTDEFTSLNLDDLSSDGLGLPGDLNEALGNL